MEDGTRLVAYDDNYIVQILNICVAYDKKEFEESFEITQQPKSQDFLYIICYKDDGIPAFARTIINAENIDDAYNQGAKQFMNPDGPKQTKIYNDWAIPLDEIKNTLLPTFLEK